MDERSAQLEDLFHAALAVPREDRAAFVRGRAPADAALAASVLALLAEVPPTGEDQRLFSLSELPPRDSPEGAPDDDNPLFDLGLRLGPYELVECIGQGGMGVVYRAVRIDGELDREVAIKLVRRGLDTAELLRRFRRERQILVHLDHAHIPRLLDAGASPDGRPYLVMDLVRGESITDYCDRRKLDVVERVKLFVEVCATVAAAHARGVLHLDLKPTNVVVTADGTPKLLDFGIAALTEGHAGRAPGGSTAGTPAYASPEQARGEPTTPASDVFSLGVTLSQLLSGVRPEARSDGARCLPPARAFASLERSDAEQAADRRATRPRRLRLLLAGDLDAVVQMATERDPARRYVSARELAADLARHLEGRALRARSSSLIYCAGRFVRRHRRLLAVASAASLTLAAFAGAALMQRQRVRRSEDALTRLVDALVFDVDAQLADRVGTLDVRATALQAAIDNIERQSAGRPFEPRTADRLAAAYERLGDIRGASRQVSQGQPAQALEAWHKALALRERLLSAAPDDSQQRVAVAGIWVRIGALRLDQGTDPSQVRRMLAAVVDQAGPEHALSPEARKALTRALWFLAEVAHRGGDWREAERHAARLARLDPGLAGAALALRGVLAQEGGDPERARELHDDALALWREDVAKRPDQATARRDLARVLFVLAHTLASPLAPNVGDRAQARARLEEGLAIMHRLLTDDRHNERARLDVSSAECSLAWVLGAADARRAEAMFMDALSSLERFASKEPPSTRLAATVATCHMFNGAYLEETRQLAAAVPHYEAAVAGLEALPDEVYDNLRLWRLREANLRLAAALHLLGRVHEAATPASRAHQVAMRVWRVDPRPWHTQRLAAAELRAARIEQQTGTGSARSRLARARALLGAQGGGVSGSLRHERRLLMSALKGAAS